MAKADARVPVKLPTGEPLLVSQIGDMFQEINNQAIELTWFLQAAEDLLMESIDKTDSTTPEGVKYTEIAKAVLKNTRPLKKDMKWVKRHMSTHAPVKVKVLAGLLAEYALLVGDPSEEE